MLSVKTVAMKNRE